MKKVLIANRGEIALRIIKTCSRLGFTTVAVYSDADADHPHVKAADEAYRLGPAHAAESYLAASTVLAIAKKHKVDAIHPGYGFLSENPAFSRAVSDAGMTFVGPSADTLELFGAKDSARRLAEECKIPVVPGYNGERQTLAVLQKEATRIGFPLLIKAAYGGGGRGMRRVDSVSKLEQQLASAVHESETFFSNGRVLLEKEVTLARHIEVQVIGDSHGNVIHLFERDCSAQRKHQKVIEESPASGLEPKTRAALLDAAVIIAKRAKLVGAATVEFLVCSAKNSEPFYFLEVNPRLQVEHPVTEMVTGLDLVELQLIVASGAPCPIAQKDVKVHGFSIEARVYAENPLKNFAPQVGLIDFCRLPQANEGQIRIDHALQQGLEVTSFYDGLLAKLITHGATRGQALERLKTAINELHIIGLTTNLSFLSALLAHSAFKSASITTQFIEEKLATISAKLLPPELSQTALAIFIATRHLLYPHSEHWLNYQNHPTALNPFKRLNYWRSGRHAAPSPQPALEAVQRFSIRDSLSQQEVVHTAQLIAVNEESQNNSLRFRLQINSAEHVVSLPFGSSFGELPVTLMVNNNRYSFAAADLRRGTFGAMSASINLHGISFKITSERELHADEAITGSSVSAPLPGVMLRVSVKAGDAVQQGQIVAAIESMKMEHSLAVPRAGTVESVSVSQGQSVKEGQLILSLTANS